MFRWILIFLLLFASTEIVAQFYVSGQEPSGVKWKQINQDYARIIYPDYSDSLAVCFVGYFNPAIELGYLNTKYIPRKIPVIVHPNSILSNGFVSWAPKRMEIVSTPSLDASPEPWLLSLALHETRHIFQLDKLNDGVVKLGYFLFGEQAVGAAAGLVPLWFLEGDAVFAETEYTFGGRGRQASFYRTYRTNLLNKTHSKFSYDKWLLGSYKDYIPNHYNFGYLMVGYANVKYGNGLWGNALEKVAKQPFTVFPFYFSIKKDIDLSRKELFNDAFSHLDSLWVSTNSISDFKSTNFLISRDIKNDYIEYRFPNIVNDTALVALKESLKNSSNIVLIDIKSGVEKTIHHPGYLTERLSVSSDYIFWTQLAVHPRWQYLNYSELWRIDLRTRKLKKLTSKTRYFNPVQIHSEKVAVIENTPEGKFFISILDINGLMRSRILIPSTLEAKELCYNDESGLIVRCSSPNGALILKYKNTASSPDTLLGPIYWDISNISCSNGLLYFTKTQNFKEELFCLDLSKNEVFQLTETPYGLTNIKSLNDGTILASVFTENGAAPAILSKDDFCYNPIIIIGPNDPLYKSPNKNDKIISKKYLSINSKKYSLAKNLFNVHSWAPVYFNPITAMTESQISVYPGATIITQNLTSTLISTLGYSYNQTHGFHAHTEWLGWYPILYGGVDIGNEYATIQGGPLAPLCINTQIKPRLKANGGLRIPYKISSGYIISEINIGFNFNYTNTATWDNQNGDYSEGISGLEPYISLYALTKMAHRDLRPKFGVYAYFSKLSSPFEKNILGDAYILNSGLYLPGLSSNHSLMFSGQWEKQKPSQYIRGPRISFPRGHMNRFYEQALAYKVNYSLPLWYPDFNIGPLVYFKRIFSNLFFDNAIINEYLFTNDGVSLANSHLKSVGIEVNSDINLFRTPYRYQIGYRFGFNINDRQYFNGLIISFDFNNLYGNTQNNVLYELNL